MKCSNCLKDKEISEFPDTGQRCNSCVKQYRDGWYQKNKNKHTKQAADRNKKKRTAFNTWKDQLSCAQCGEEYSKCLHFHHIKGENKNFVIAHTSSRISVDKMIAELGKCGVLCGNCHIKVHNGIIPEPPKIPEHLLEQLRVGLTIYNK